MEMSPVRGHRFVFLVVVWAIGGYAMAQAQNPSELLERFQNNQIESLLALYRSGQVTRADWRQFLRLIQMTDADSAVTGYFILYNQTSDARLKQLIRRKIARFYAIQGFYETARRVENDLVFFQKLQGIKKQQQVHYGVQLAAFANRKNALHKQRELSLKGVQTTIIIKEKNGQNLFALIHGNFESKEAAGRALRTIRQKFNLTGYVVEF